jgi:tetratricopeptide (TPR) repeat protein
MAKKKVKKVSGQDDKNIILKSSNKHHSEDTNFTSGNSSGKISTPAERARIQVNFRDGKFRALLMLFFALLIFGFIWAAPVDDFNDPWYGAILLVDSSNRVADPALKSKLLEDGGEQLRYLLKEHPYHARIYYFMGVYHSIKQNWDSAIYCQRKAIFIGSGGLVNNVEFDAHRELITALFNKGNQFLQNKGVDSAIAYYESALKEGASARPTQRINALLGQVLNNASIASTYKGNNLAQNNMHAEALKAFETALKYVPNEPDVYNNIGILYINLKDYQKAEQAFKKALEIDPGYEKARQNLNGVKQAALKQ